MIPSSPRKRRRLTYLAVLTAVALAVVGIVWLVPEPKQPNTHPDGTEGPAVLARPINTHVSAARRRAIDATLDRFIPAAMARQSMSTAWKLAGPELKSGSTLSQWLKDSSPIPYYPVGGTKFHNWATLDADQHDVDFNLLVYPRQGAKMSPWLLSGEMVLVGKQWRVNRLYTVASMEPDDSPLGFGSNKIPELPAPKSLIAEKWLLSIVALITMAVLFPLAFGVGSYVRGSRARRNYGSNSRALPPLPLRSPRP